MISSVRVLFWFPKITSRIHKLLTYRETNWKNKKGFKIHTYRIRIKTIDASKTRKEQQTKLEKISLVVFLDKEQKKPYFNLCRRLSKLNKDFHQNKNLHITIFGFGPLVKHEYQIIQERLQKYFTLKRDCNLKITLDAIRLGMAYRNNKTLSPVQGMSNGTVIATGDIVKNESFFSFSNQLTVFLLKDKRVGSILGRNFRKKFPVVWCTLGYFDAKEVKINNDLQRFFVQHADLSPNIYFSFTEISLVKSKYKNLRYPKVIQKYNCQFSVPHNTSRKNNQPYNN